MKHDTKLFVERFTEVCGTNEPAKIQRLLNVSYQAAKNYLTGRVPDTSVLVRVAERTPYSIHWLLIGKGDKLVCGSKADGHELTAETRQLIRNECITIINEILQTQKQL